MQIKEAYQRRIKEEITPSKYKSFADSSSVIGSIKTGSVNYKSKQTFFKDYKTRQDVLAAKTYIKQFSDPDILELKDKKWNNSNSVPKKYEEDISHKSKLLKIKLGFSDFKPVQYKGNKIYSGTEGRDNFQGWNVSSLLENKQKKLGYLYTNVNALQNTVNFNSNKLQNYKSLKNRYYESNQFQKSSLMESSDILQQMKSSYLYTNPNASPQKTNATAMKMFDQSRRDKLKLSLSSMGTQDSFRGFKANLSPNQKNNIKSTYFHTGAWQKQIKKQLKQSEIQSEQDNQDQVWSCCMNSDKNSRGCSKRVEDGNKMNLCSYNS